ncbi:MAG TPA: oligosaccharide flippase family protein [Terriglobales bacterium]|nr:oligosaccharide flippase family protein [Terriglobales bacterium]
MRKFEKGQIIKNISSSWFSLGINIVTGIFLSPFILHRLGDTAFGVWVLIFSVTGYYGLFDLGIRSSVVHYVSRYTATEENEELAKIVNTSLFSYSCIGLASLIVTLVLCFNVEHVFRKVPLDMIPTARWLLLMVGASVAVSFPLGVFGGFLEGLQRFYILNWTNIVSTLLRAALIVVVLKRGYGLLMVAFITIILPLIAAILRAFIALHLRPVPIGLHYVKKGTFRRIANYSSSSFMIMVAGRLKFKTDEIVIGTMMSAAAITYFNIGNRIVDYAGQVVTTLAQVFVPMSAQSGAKGDVTRLRKIFVVGNRVCAFIIFPICATLLILGKSVIEVWMGRKYVEVSYPVLVIMILSCTLWWSQSASGRVLFGLSRHNTWAKITLIEGIGNLILSVALIRYLGIIGDALGTAIPLALSTTYFMPRHVSKLLGIRLTTYVREAYTLPFLLTMPLVATLLLLKQWFVPHTYRQLGLQLLIGGAVYGAGLLWAYRANRALSTGELVAQKEAESVEIKLLPDVVEPSQADVNS